MSDATGSAGRVPHLLHVFSTFVPAGPQVRTVQLIRALGGEFRHSVVAMDGRLDARELLAGIDNVSYLDAPPKAGTLQTVPRMRALLKRTQPDLTLTYNFGAIDTVLAARTLPGVPLIHHEDGFRPDETESFKLRRVLLRRFALRRAHAVVVISQRLKEIALKTWKLHPPSVRFIANGIELGGFETRDGNAELRAELGIPADAFVVGAVGHLRPEKNFQRLFRAAARVAEKDNVHLLVLGEGDERASLDEIAARPALAGRVTFAGFQKQLSPYYRCMDLFALTSDTEQMPMALLEAMASRLPVLATNVGDVVAMLPGEQAAFVVLPGGESCEEALAQGLTTLAADAGLRERLADKNRGRVERFFSQDGMVQTYRKLFREVV